MPACASSEGAARSVGIRFSPANTYGGIILIRFLLASGKPLREPVALYGPIVMNTQEQIRQAYEELQTG